MALAVCIITLNEQDNLPRCLQSIEGLAAQLVLLDSGSTDGTVGLARAAGAEVHVRAFESLARQREQSIALAREDWVLCLDADEWLDAELRAAVAAIAASPDPGGPDGYELNRRTEYLGAWIDHCGWSPQWRLRLVRRGRSRCSGSDPHERIEIDGRAGRLAGRLCHRPYRTLAAHVGKVNRYTDQMAELRWRAGVRVPPLALVLRPPARFALMFVLRGGFLDGWRGLVVSGMGAFYVFLKYAKLRERWRLAAATAPVSGGT